MGLIDKLKPNKNKRDDIYRGEITYGLTEAEKLENGHYETKR